MEIERTIQALKNDPLLRKALEQEMLQHEMEESCQMLELEKNPLDLRVPKDPIEVDNQRWLKDFEKRNRRQFQQQQNRMLKRKVT